MGPKQDLPHSQKQEVHGVLAALRITDPRMFEDAALISRKPENAAVARNRKWQETDCPLEAAQAWGHLDFVSHHCNKRNIISLKGRKRWRGFQSVRCVAPD